MSVDSADHPAEMPGPKAGKMTLSVISKINETLHVVMKGAHSP